MAVARVTEVVASSTVSFQDAVERGVERGAKTLDVTSVNWGAWGACGARPSSSAEARRSSAPF